MSSPYEANWEDMLSRRVLYRPLTRLRRPGLSRLDDQVTHESEGAFEELETVGESHGEGHANVHEEIHGESHGQSHRQSRGEDPPPANDSPESPGPKRERVGRIFFHSKQRAGPLNFPEHEEPSSTAYPEKIKSRIGPWVLGDHLGKGATGSVVLCRHRVTRQLAAVKILPKNSARLIQAASIINFDQKDSSLPEGIEGQRRIPVSIEREVAMLKLIQHPNITKLYDIWENGSQIYLVLEYIDNGDLYHYITRNGPFAEVNGVRVFRQIMSAMSYCHDLKICHRDLKPENILLSFDGHIKIADFRMAALHQTAGHQLSTCCGSPHYAAPEVLTGQLYSGYKVDIWSMGVILYAILSGLLPFSDDDTEVLLQKIKVGDFVFPSFLSHHARDLIARILQNNPNQRISIESMWRHPLVNKYHIVDDLTEENGLPFQYRKNFEGKAIPPSEIDTELVRQLRSLWHSFTIEELKVALSSDEPNDQKVFYHLLQQYRERQLEDFDPDIAHAQSDYHHLRPSVWKEKRTTREFINEGDGLRRSVSRITVVSSVADTGAGTVATYDPFNSCHTPLERRPSQISRARVTVHRPEASQPEGGDDNFLSGVSSPFYPSTRSNSPNPVDHPTWRGFHGLGRIDEKLSSASTTPSPKKASYSRCVPIRRKRGVDFSQLRGRQAQNKKKTEVEAQSHKRRSLYQDSDDSGTPRPDSDVFPASERWPPLRVVKRKPVPILTNREAMTNEEVRKVSHKLAMDCDEAFGGSVFVESSFLGAAGPSRNSTPLAASLGSRYMSSKSTPTDPDARWLDRPLPPLPPSSKASTPSPVTEGPPVPAKRIPSQGENLTRQGKVVARLTRRSMPLLSDSINAHVTSNPRRTAMANARTSRNLSGPTKRHSSAFIPMGPEKGGRPRLTRSDNPDLTKAEDRGLDYLSRADNTIRVVISTPKVNPFRKHGVDDSSFRARVASQSQSRLDSAETLASLAMMSPGIVNWNARGHSQMRQSDWADEESHDDTELNGWFAGLDVNPNSGDADTLAPAPRLETSESGTLQPTSRPRPQQAQKSEPSSSGGRRRSILARRNKKNFGFKFWKLPRSKPKMKRSRGFDHEDEEPLFESRAKGEGTECSHHELMVNNGHPGDAPGQRNIEVQPSWLARVFRVKPVVEYLCVTISHVEARNEALSVPQDWAKYGVEDLEIHEDRSIVFARINRKNYLRLREASIAIEFIQAWEEGNPTPLCIIRFTQERGAASSLREVLRTTRGVLQGKDVILKNKQLEKRLIQTLNS